MGDNKEIMPPQYDVNAKMDACIDLTVRRFVYSTLGGAIGGLLLFSQSSLSFFTSASVLYLFAYAVEKLEIIRYTYSRRFSCICCYCKSCFGKLRFRSNDSIGNTIFLSKSQLPNQIILRLKFSIG